MLTLPDRIPIGQFFCFDGICMERDRTMEPLHD